MRPIIDFVISIVLLTLSTFLPFFTIAFGVWLSYKVMDVGERSAAPIMFGIVGFVAGLPLPLLLLNFVVCQENSALNKLYYGFLNMEKDRQITRLNKSDTVENSMERWKGDE